MKKVYLDNAATTQLRKEVIHTMSNALKTEYGNPSSTHSYGRSSKSLLENCRKEIADLFGAQSSEIIFTSGGTEADNLVLCSCVTDSGVERIITSPIEHHAVLHTIEVLGQRHGVEINYVKLDTKGGVELTHLEELLKASSKKTLVSLMHVNNEVGTMLPIQEVAELCKKHNALYHSDTVQSIGHYPMDFSKTPIDFAAVAAHKFHGPKGVGFAFIRKNSGLKALIQGGAQERGMRAGTEAVYAIAGMTEALKIAYQNLEKEREYVIGLKNYFKEKISEKIPNVAFNGYCEDNTKSTYTVLNVRLPIDPQKALMLVFQLDLKGIACSQGSACQSGSQEGSHVLNTLLTEEERQNPSVRFSFSIFNTKEELDYTIDVLDEFIRS